MRLFKESNGDWSFTRVTAFIVIVAAVTIPIIQTLIEHADVNETLVLGMLGIAFSGKVSQKYIEKKWENGNK